MASSNLGTKGYHVFRSATTSVENYFIFTKNVSHVIQYGETGLDERALK